MTLRFTPLPGEDICRNNHGGDPNSEAANARTNKARDAARIYAFVHGQGMHGATGFEAGEALEMLPQTVSARFSEMRKSGDLIVTDKRRPTGRGHCKAAVCIARGVGELRPAVQGRLPL